MLSIRVGSDLLIFLKNIDCRYKDNLLCLEKFCKASAMSTEIPIYTESSRSKFCYLISLRRASTCCYPFAGARIF
jgi:hypothetical protein